MLHGHHLPAPNSLLRQQVTQIAHQVQAEHRTNDRVGLSMSDTKQPGFLVCSSRRHEKTDRVDNVFCSVLAFNLYRLVENLLHLAVWKPVRFLDNVLLLERASVPQLFGWHCIFAESVAFSTTAHMCQLNISRVHSSPWTHWATLHIRDTDPTGSAALTMASSLTCRLQVHGWYETRTVKLRRMLWSPWTEDKPKQSPGDKSPHSIFSFETLVDVNTCTSLEQCTLTFTNLCFFRSQYNSHDVGSRVSAFKRTNCECNNVVLTEIIVVYSGCSLTKTPNMEVHCFINNSKWHYFAGVHHSAFLPGGQNRPSNTASICPYFLVSRGLLLTCLHFLPLSPEHTPAWNEFHPGAPDLCWNLLLAFHASLIDNLAADTETHLQHVLGCMELSQNQLCATRLFMG